MLTVDFISLGSPWGPYFIETDKAGFAKYRQGPIVLLLNQVAVQNLPMIAFLSMIAFLALALIVWKFVFAGLRHRPLARAIGAPQEQKNNVIEQLLPVLGQSGEEVIATNSVENGWERVNPVSRKERAEMYLRRVVALTGATQVRNAYVLDVDRMRFKVRDRLVSRVQDVTDPKSSNEITCFYPVNKGMPKAEVIATALLQLANNPALFDKWAVQNGLAFKADGHVFTRAH